MGLNWLDFLKVPRQDLNNQHTLVICTNNKDKLTALSLAKSNVLAKMLQKSDLSAIVWREECYNIYIQRYEHEIIISSAHSYVITSKELVFLIIHLVWCAD